MTRFDAYGYPVFSGPGESAEPLAEEVLIYEPRAQRTLIQMGYYRADRVFCSLSLTADQAKTLTKAYMAFRHDGTPEELVTEALELWLEKHG